MSENILDTTEFPKTPLTHEEEQRFAKLGTDLARHMLIMHSMHEAIPYLLTYGRGMFTKADAISLGYEALSNAAKNFREGHDCRFFVYAVRYLWGAASRYWNKLNVVRGVNEDKLDRLDALPAAFADLHMASGDDLGYCEPDLSGLDREMKLAVLRPYLNRLTERERMVLDLVYQGRYDLVTIGQMMQPPVSRSAIQICHAKAIRKLRRLLSDKRALFFD